MLVACVCRVDAPKEAQAKTCSIHGQESTPELACHLKILQATKSRNCGPSCPSGDLTSPSPGHDIVAPHRLCN